MRALPRAAQVYIGVVVGAAAVAVLRGPYAGTRWWTLAVLMLLFWVCESVPTVLSSQRASVSLSFCAGLASVVLLGPAGAAVVGTAAALRPRRILLVKRVFNGAQHALSGYVAGEAFVLLGGHPGVPTQAAYPGIIAPFAGATVTYAAMNALLVSGVLWLTQDRGSDPASRGVRWRSLATMQFSYLGYGMLGLLIAALWATVNWFAAVLVLLPLFVARWALDQYVGQQRAYDATIATLCQAVETKDYYTRGHCTRVSKAAGLIAEQVGMRPERVQAIRYAGMLHDVGKLGVPTKVLQKSGPLTEEEFAAIQLHPMRGLEIVREIGFLDEALAGITHHHERLDGKGYPMGLAGDEIPEFARVLSVADAFDSMTSTRSYRRARGVPEALAELHKWAGTQFDPVMVEALSRAVATHGWQPPDPVLPPDDAASEAAQQDHDDPTAPLQIVKTPRPAVSQPSPPQRSRT